MKLEVGMYVRTKKYGIAKIICGTSNKFNIDVFKKDGCTLRCQKERDILKASFNIIDLIEVGDYVNGLPIQKINKYLSTNEKYLVLLGSCSDWENEDIKSVVTKEQFENMKYRIGE